MSQVWTCEFCGSAGEPLYPVNVGAHRDEMMRCLSCKSCSVKGALDDSDLADFYANSYFQGEAKEKHRADLLAQHYVARVKPFIEGRAPDSRVLEIGAGYGRFAARLADEYDFTIDVIEPSLNARAHIESDGSSVRLAASTLEDLPYGDVYDLVFAFHVIEHLPRMKPFLSSVRRVTRPGALVLLITPNAMAKKFIKFSYRWGWACPEEHVQFLSYRVPDSFWESAGFRKVTIQGVTPRTIAYPSGVLPFVNAADHHLVSRMELASRRHRSLEVGRKALSIAADALEPNKTETNLLAVEHALNRFSKPEFKDELLIVLERS